MKRLRQHNEPRKLSKILFLINRVRCRLDHPSKVTYTHLRKHKKPVRFPLFGLQEAGFQLFMAHHCELLNLRSSST